MIFDSGAFAAFAFGFFAIGELFEAILKRDKWKAVHVITGILASMLFGFIFGLVKS